MKTTQAKKAKRSVEAHLSTQKLNLIDKLVREAVGKNAVEAVFKSSLSEKYGRYIWFGISNGQVLSVNPDNMATRWLDPKSASVKKWQRMQKAALAREEAAARKADNKKAKAAAKKAEAK